MKTKTATNQRQSGSSTNLTFLQHLIELRTRLFWVVGTILVASSLAFPFQQNIIAVVTAPLEGQKLYYLTPAGGFSFIVKLSLYMGIMVAIPVIMYHLYRYLEPLFNEHRFKLIRYTSLSATLAIIGGGFAYFVSLPAALHFLTSVGVGGVQAMLTADAYLSFVMTYILMAAALFQLPLVLVIIDSITPLKPSNLLKAMRFVVVGAFVVAAVISPTPDIMNQALLAVPMIAMYGVGIGLVWWRNRNTPSTKVLVVRPQVAIETISPQLIREEPRPAFKPKATSIDGFRRQPVVRRAKLTPSAPVPARQPARSIDGIVSMHRHLPLSPA